MIYSPTAATDFRLLHPEIIALEPEDFVQAAEVSDRVFNEAAQWQIYLSVLGLQGLTHWLHERNPQLTIDATQSNIWQPQYANALDAVCNVRIGHFKLCLIVTEHLLEDTIAIPRAAIDLPEFAAHFYVLLEVQEELEQVAIQGVMPRNQLVRCQQTFHCQTEGWYGLIPLPLFDAEVDHLIAYFSYLNAESIPLPTEVAAATTPLLPPADLDAVISSLLTHPQPLWQLLTWQQGAPLLRDATFLELLHQQQRSSQLSDSSAVRLVEMLTLLIQPVINAARWLQGELDACAQELGLSLAQELALAAPMLSVDRFERAIAELREQGMEIPDQPASVYQIIDLHGNLLRLCSVAWAQDATRCCLLFILGRQADEPLPDGLTLRISNDREVLHEPTTDFDDPFLFARVQGSRGDRFVVTIIPPNQSGLTLPAFGFENV